MGAQRLEHPQKNKIAKFINAGCIEKVNNDHYICKPLKGYNTRTYDMRRTPNGDFKCNCQGYKKRGDCSHVQAKNIIAEENQAQGCFF